jgi:cell division transport system permease protein
MKQKPAKISSTRIRTSYATTVVSISLVLFLLGLAGLLALNASRISDYVRENIGFSVILKDNVKEVDIHRVQKELDAMEFVKSTKYVSKEAAAIELQAELGEEFLSFLGYNPLLSSIDVKFHAQYANPDSIAVIDYELRKFSEIKEVYYQKSLVNLVHENVRKLSVVLLLFSGLLLIIAIALINNTIRLAIYSKRMIIRTMQLVGATKTFIQTPFVFSGAIQGIIGALLAIAMLTGVMYAMHKEFAQIGASQDIELIGILFISVIALGIAITAGSTYLSVNKFLKIRQNQLYI